MYNMDIHGHIRAMDECSLPKPSCLQSCHCHPRLFNHGLARQFAVCIYICKLGF